MFLIISKAVLKVNKIPLGRHLKDNLSVCTATGYTFFLLSNLLITYCLFKDFLVQIYLIPNSSSVVCNVQNLELCPVWSQLIKPFTEYFSFCNNPLYKGLIFYNKTTFCSCIYNLFFFYITSFHLTHSKSYVSLNFLLFITPTNLTLRLCKDVSWLHWKTLTNESFTLVYCLKLWILTFYLQFSHQLLLF